jgi:hypothetical protein
MCSGKGIGHWITHSPDHAPRFVRCQSIRQRPPAIGTQNSFFSGVARAWWYSTAALS